MKKIIVFLLVLVSIMCLYGCENEVDLTVYVSQYRENIFEGENENYKLTLYIERREEPFIADAFVGNLENVVIAKIESKTESVDGVKIFFNIDNKDYEGQFKYNPIKARFTSEIKVENLPKNKEFQVVIESNGEKQDIQLTSKVNEKTLTPKDILKSIASYDKNTVNTLFKGDKVNSEIHVRLLRNDNKNYYYVGFVSKNNKTIAYLVDGESAEILAVKDL